jgi:hypothetical protein
MHINRFVDRLKAHELRAAKDFVMPLQDARDLHAEITKLLMQLQDLQQAQAQDAQVIELEFTGGNFK